MLLKHDASRVHRELQLAKSFATGTRASVRVCELPRCNSKRAVPCGRSHEATRYTSSGLYTPGIRPALMDTSVRFGNVVAAQFSELRGQVLIGNGSIRIDAPQPYFMAQVSGRGQRARDPGPQIVTSRWYEAVRPDKWKSRAMTKNDCLLSIRGGSVKSVLIRDFLPASVSSGQPIPCSGP